MRHLIPISGKDSLCTALVQLARDPDLPYELMFNPTGQEFPVVNEWLTKVSDYFNKKIVMVGEDLQSIIEGYNWFLPSRNARYCTKESKIIPMEKFIGNDPVTIYFGIRADEDRGGYSGTKKNIIVSYPLKELGINLPMVYSIINNAGLKPPNFFWQRLYDDTCKIIGESYIVARFTEWEIDMIFCGRTRANCAMCFNQRMYEWVWLLWTYPDMFWEFETWEHNVSEYFLAGKERPLKWIAENAEKIYTRRLNAVVKFIRKTQQQIIKFEESEDDIDFIDMFPVTSCGLLCGK